MNFTIIGRALILLMLMGLAFRCTEMKAATINASSAALADVSAAISSARAGDTVLVPSGTATWSGGLTINKNISVIGAGTNGTVITCSGSAATLTGSSAGVIRLSGFRFNGNSSKDGLSLLAGPNTRVRIDHCWIQGFYYTWQCHAVGVMDHCTIITGNVYGNRLGRIYCCSPSGGDSLAEEAYGWNNWCPIDPGATTNAMYFEDNRIVVPYLDLLVSEYESGGYVFRYNTFNITMNGNQIFDAHGNQGNINSGGSRGCYLASIYKNTFNLSSGSYQFLLLRGGSGYVCSNVLVGGTAYIDAYEEDASGVWGYSGPPYQDAISNFYSWANSPTINIRAYDSATASILGGGAYYYNAAPSSPNFLAYPHPLVTALDGGQTSAILSITPSSRDFGSVLVGSTSNRTFTAQNIGGGTLSGVASVAAPFSIVAGSPYSVGAGQSQSVTVRYAPIAVNADTQNVTFTGGGGAIVPVSGAGVSATAQPEPPANLRIVAK